MSASSDSTLERFRSLQCESRIIHQVLGRGITILQGQTARCIFADDVHQMKWNTAQAPTCSGSAPAC